MGRACAAADPERPVAAGGRTVVAAAVSSTAVAAAATSAAAAVATIVGAAGAVGAAEAVGAAGVVGAAEAVGAAGAAVGCPTGRTVGEAGTFEFASADIGVAGVGWAAFGPPCTARSSVDAATETSSAETKPTASRGAVAPSAIAATCTPAGACGVAVRLTVAGAGPSSDVEETDAGAAFAMASSAAASTAEAVRLVTVVGSASGAVLIGLGAAGALSIAGAALRSIWVAAAMTATGVDCFAAETASVPRSACPSDPVATAAGIVGRSKAGRPGTTGRDAPTAWPSSDVA